MIIVQGDPHLPEIVLALRTPGRLPRLLNRREQQGHEDGDDGDHHQEFDQRKRRAAARDSKVVSPHRESPFSPAGSETGDFTYRIRVVLVPPMCMQTESSWFPG